MHHILLIVKKDKIGNQILDGMEELNLLVGYLIPFKSCFKGFPVIKYTYIPCLKVAMLCVFALCGLNVFMVKWAIAYSEPCQASKMELFAKLVTS